MALGVCLGAFGIEGYVKLRPHSGETSHFHHLISEKILLSKDSRNFKLVIESIKVHGPLVLVKFKGIETPEAVQAYQGFELFADRKFALPLKSGEYYISDLMGLSLEFEGEIKGEVVGVWKNGEIDMFEVKTTDERIVQLPFQDPFVSEVDTENKKIILRVDWILN